MSESMSMRPKLYHCPRTRSFRALWALEEIGTPYDLEVLRFPPRETDPSYLAENPLGTVPLLIDGEVRLTESAAICAYLAGKHPEARLAVEPHEADFGWYLNWLHFGEATLTFPQAIVLRYSRFEPSERQSEQVSEDYTKWFYARARALETALEGREHLAANRFTMADVSVGYALMLSRITGLYDGLSAVSKSYFEHLSTRPGFLRAVARTENRPAAEAPK